MNIGNMISDGEVLYLTRNDLYVRLYSQNLKYITLFDFKIPTKNMYSANVIIFTDNDNSIKILKNRYNDNSVFLYIRCKKIKRILTTDFIRQLKLKKLLC